MVREIDLQKAIRVIIIVTCAFGITVFNSKSSYSDVCGAYCKARQARIICHNAVVMKGLKGNQRDVEFEKCKVDPNAHEEIQGRTGDTGDDLD